MSDKLTNDELKMYMDNINQTLAEFKQDFKDFCDKVDKNYVHKDVFDEYKKSNDEKVSNNADNIKWTLRYTIATLVGVIINFVFFLIKLKS